MSGFSDDFNSEAGAGPSPACTELMKAVEARDNPLVRKILDSRQVTDFESMDDRGWTPLLLALNDNNRECVVMLLDAGANVNHAAGRMGETPLTYAAGDYYGASPLMVSILLSRGADPNLLPYNHEDGPLLTAAKDGKEAITLLLLKNGADIEQYDTWHNTAVHIAAANGHAGVIRILAEHGASLNKLGGGSETALEKAIDHHNREAFEALLDCGAEIAVANRHGRTLLMAAAQNGETGVMEHLVASGLAIDFQDKEGKTALMYAAEAGKKDAVRKLMELGADASVSNSGKTARDIADEKGHFHVVQEIDDLQKRLGQQQKPSNSDKPFRLSLKGGR
jgi:ankyrin repeat protein